MNSNPLRWPFRGQFLLGSVICAGLIAYALYVQFVQRLLPCPFCIFQRVAFAALGIVFLIGAVHAPKQPVGRRVYGVLAFICAAIGAGIAARHVWVQQFPPEIPSCGAGMDFMLQSMPLFGVIRKVLTASGDCSNIDWTFLGLSMPAWCLLFFVLLAGCALHAGFRRR